MPRSARAAGQAHALVQRLKTPPSAPRDGRRYGHEADALEYIRFVSRRPHRGRRLQPPDTMLLEPGRCVARRQIDRRPGTLDGGAQPGAADGPPTALPTRARSSSTTRQASDLLGATTDGPAGWITSTRDGWVYCTPTQQQQPRRRAAARRRRREPANNTMGHITCWKDDGDFDGVTCVMNALRRRRPANAHADARSGTRGDALGCPDGLWSMRAACSDRDRHEHAWRWARRPGNGWATTRCRCLNGAPAAAGASSSGPGCEITMRRACPTGVTMFVNIQHPAERARRAQRSDAARISNWPDFNPAGRLASATALGRQTTRADRQLIAVGGGGLPARAPWQAGKPDASSQVGEG